MNELAASEGSVYLARGHRSPQSDMARQPSNETALDAAGNYVLNALNYINKLNESLSPEAIKCLEVKHQEELEWVSLGRRLEEQTGCEIDWDSLLCWPRTPPGTTATLPCLEELNGIRYDSTRGHEIRMSVHRGCGRGAERRLRAQRPRDRVPEVEGRLQPLQCPSCDVMRNIAREERARV